MLRLEKQKSLFKCVRCGECCRNLFGKRFGAAILPQEKTQLEKQAKKIGVSVNFYPLTKNWSSEVTLWQFTDNKCPFLHANECRIYNDRPLLCRAYPLMPYGVGACSSIEQQSRLFHVYFTFQQVAAGNLYLQKVGDEFKKAVWLFDAQTCKWRLNRR